MIFFSLFLSIFFYALFYKEIIATRYVLFALFFIRLIYLVYYISIQQTYTGLKDDVVYYSVAMNLLRDTPYELFMYDMRIAYVLSMGQHILYGFLNFLVYYFFGANIFNMLLFNYTVFILSLVLVRSLVFKLGGNSRVVLIILCLYLVYPDFIAISTMNLKDFVVLLLFIFLNWATVNIQQSKLGIIQWVLNIIYILLTLNFLFYIRFYLVYFYVVSLMVYYIIYKKSIQLRTFVIICLLIMLPFSKQLYDFVLSPFFLTVGDDYWFYKIPAVLNWLLIFPLVLYGFLRCITKQQMIWPMVYLFIIFLFYALVGAEAGLAGPRQRLFVEPFYVIFLGYAIYLIWLEKRIMITKKYSLVFRREANKLT